MHIGILALQGGFNAHRCMLDTLQIPTRYVRTQKDLHGIHGLILPGGESSVQLHPLHESGLFQAVTRCAHDGMPMLGTCAGAILLAKHVTCPAQSNLGAADVTVVRNAYGRQLSSHIAYGEWTPTSQPLEMPFIRAPKFRELGSHIRVLAHLDNEPTCIQDGPCILCAFHPELTNDATVHQHFLTLPQP